MQPMAQVDAFPEATHPALRAVNAAMVAAGRPPKDYTAAVTEDAGGLLQVYARHVRHPDGWTGRGDPCGRCCTVTYNPSTGGVSRVVGIR